MTFYEKADFLGNGQFEEETPGEVAKNSAGGAILNAGKMEVRYSRAMLYLSYLYN